MEAGTGNISGAVAMALREAWPKSPITRSFQTKLKSISIWNRTDCCAERLENSRVVLTDPKDSISRNAQSLD